MPTGLTAKILEDDNFTWEDFVWRCARQFGPYVRFREDPLDKKITIQDIEAVFDRDIDRYQTKVTAAQAQVDRINTTPTKKLKDRWVKEQENVRAENKRRKEDAERNLARLNEFLDKAKKFNPPTEDHVRFKEFLVGQIEDTIRWDAKAYTNDLDQEFNEEEYKARLLKNARWEIVYNSQQLENTKSNKKASIQWVKDLMKEVPTQCRSHMKK